jgi:hypothetical protein
MSAFVTADTRSASVEWQRPVTILLRLVWTRADQVTNCLTFLNQRYNWKPNIPFSFHSTVSTLGWEGQGEKSLIIAITISSSLLTIRRRPSLCTATKFQKAEKKKKVDWIWKPTCSNRPAALNQQSLVELNVPLAMNMKIAVFRDVTSHILPDNYPGGFQVVFSVTRDL